MKKHTFLMKSFLVGASVVGLLLAAPLTSSASDNDGGHYNSHRRQHYNAHGWENLRHGLDHYVASYGWNGSYSHHRQQRRHHRYHHRQQRHHQRYHHNWQHHYNPSH